MESASDGTGAISPATPISRFVFDKDCLKGQNLWRAFKPDKTDNETSVFDVSGLGQAERWAIADEHVAPGRGKPTLAEALLAVRDASVPPLSVARATPPPRHMAIRGWPADGKDVVKMLAMKLASVSALTARPE